MNPAPAPAETAPPATPPAIASGQPDTRDTPLRLLYTRQPGAAAAAGSGAAKLPVASFTSAI